MRKRSKLLVKHEEIKEKPNPEILRNEDKI
jgi:hypothetical protein